MTSIVQGTWDKLTKPVGDRLVARVALPEITTRLLCALDSKGGRHLLISLSVDDQEFRDKQSRGISVTTRGLTVHGQDADKYIDIECLDAAGHAILDLMGGEIADSLTDTTKQSAGIVKRVLSKWRRFWGQIPQQILSREEQLGLFAELWFLSVWVLPKFGSDAIMIWRGPWGSRHDFEWANKSVEVKATTNVRGRIHRVHGLNQLENPMHGPLYVFSVCLREEGGSANNLPKLIEACRNQLIDSEEAMARFENALIQSGYSPLYEDEYVKLNLRIIEELLFLVDEDFPKLTSFSFPLGVPSGIERVDYEINLNTFDHLIIANRPDQLPFS